MSVHKKIPPNRYSRLAGYALHVYECLVLLYRYMLCLSVRLYPINVKTAETIGPEFFYGNSHASREGLRIIKS